jgi:hypothetical protein
VASQDILSKGVLGESTTGFGVQGQAAGGTGVSGHSQSGAGVQGQSDTGIAVVGVNFVSSKPAIFGRATGNGTGVYGFSSDALPVPAPTRTGVYGYAVQNNTSRGVTGETTAGHGVHGIATSGVGGHFSADATGTALQAVGRVEFNTAGLTAVAEGTNNIVIAPGSDIGASTRVICTLESNQSGLFIHRLTKQTAADTFRVFLSENVQTGSVAKIAWFVIG